MGTRGLTCVVLDGAMRIAQYGQWDHYPEGQGITVYSFLKKLTPERLKQFKANVAKLTDETEDGFNAKWKSLGIDLAGSDGFVPIDKSDEFKAKWPHLNRDMGAEILEYVLKAPPETIRRDEKFAADSLMCEWVYVVDLDKKRLEVFKGFQEKPHKKGRFANLPLERPGQRAGSGATYYPAAEVKRFKFNALPKNKRAFVKAIQDACPEKE